MSWSQPVETYLEDLGAPTPAPGGGASSALAGAVGAAQLQMVVALTCANPRYAGVAGRMAELEAALEADCRRFLALADEDAEAYGRVARALRLPRGTDTECAARSEELAAPIGHHRRVGDPLEEFGRQTEKPQAQQQSDAPHRPVLHVSPPHHCTTSTVRFPVIAR